MPVNFSRLNKNDDAVILWTFIVSVVDFMFYWQHLFLLY